MATRKLKRAGGAGPGRGRSLVALLLVGFVLVAVGVIWRRSYGIARARELQALDRQRQSLEAQKSKLESDIRELSSRERIVPAAERLGMRIPSDSSVIYLHRPSSPQSQDAGAPR